MVRPTKDQLRAWLSDPGPLDDLRKAIRQSPTTPVLLDTMREILPDLTQIPQLTYTTYRLFEHTGSRDEYQTPYFHKRGQLTRAVMEYIMGDVSLLDTIHDLLWSICEETSWVLPAHEEQGPDYWEIDPPYVRTEPFGAHTMLTREPDSIDLFAAETGASLAEVIHLIGDELAPEVRQRVRQEVERRIFKPYLAHARDHWWFEGELNWNGVCNGSIGLAFLRLENDIQTTVDALALVLEGFETYIARGFEADGGSIEGVGYWNYGLMYYITVAELLREISRGEFDLLAQPRLRQIAEYPPGMTLYPPVFFINVGDAPIQQELSPGVVNRLAERTGVDALKSLLVPEFSVHDSSAAKLAITCRHAAWWDMTKPAPAFTVADFYQPASGVIKFVGQTANGRPVVLAAKAGHNDGHHSHTDIASFIVNIDGESLLPDLGRGLYAKQYFRKERYDNVFNNSYGHSVPRIGGALQKAGPEFNGCEQFNGTISEHGVRDGKKFAIITFEDAYDLPTLTSAQRTLTLDTASGEVLLEDAFAFEAVTQPIEEAFVTWYPVQIDGARATIKGERTTLELAIAEPDGASFKLETLEEESRANNFPNGTVYRMSVALPDGVTKFKMNIKPTR